MGIDRRIGLSGKEGEHGALFAYSFLNVTKEQGCGCERRFFTKVQSY